MTDADAGCARDVVELAEGDIVAGIEACSSCCVCAHGVGIRACVSVCVYSFVRRICVLERAHGLVWLQV